jgi:hypothetical protein
VVNECGEDDNQYVIVIKSAPDSKERQGQAVKL